jgi:LmbE family N-acetylglucosaminyl deacetylase
MNRVLIIAAHPDDEALGCGGTLARHTQSGDAVEALFLTDGVGARGEGGAKSRREAAEHSARVLGIRALHFHDFPDNAMDNVSMLAIVKAVEGVVAKQRPGIVYVHHGSDLNVDHRIAHQAALVACRPQPGVSVSEIYAYAVPSSTEWSSTAIGPVFNPTHFVEITQQLERKLEALRCYRQEIRDFPHSRSLDAVKAQAMWCGASVGFAAAEAFETIRTILPQT